MTNRSLSLSACVALLVAAAPARAQSGADIRRIMLFDEVDVAGAAPACVARIPDAALTPTNYYLRVVAPDDAPRDRDMGPFWSAVGEDVAAMVRTSLGGVGDSLPSAEPLLDWRSVAGGVVVTAYRDHRFLWRPARGAAASSADTLLVGALAAMGGSPLPPWPAGVADSSSVVLSFGARPGDVKPQAVWGGFALPAFTLGQPPLTPAEQGRNYVSPRYPDNLRRDGVQGTVTLDFVIDTLGRVGRRTVRDRSSADAMIAIGHQDFLNATVDVVTGRRFVPARVGGCAVPMLVRQDFAFTIGGAAVGEMTSVEPGEPGLAGGRAAYPLLRRP